MHYSSTESAKTALNVYHISLKRHATSLITADCISLCSVNNLTNNKILLTFSENCTEPIMAMDDSGCSKPDTKQVKWLNPRDI